MTRFVCAALGAFGAILGLGIPASAAPIQIFTTSNNSAYQASNPGNTQLTTNETFVNDAPPDQGQYRIRVFNPLINGTSAGSRLYVNSNGVGVHDGVNNFGVNPGFDAGDSVDVELEAAPPGGAGNSTVQVLEICFEIPAFGATFDGEFTVEWGFDGANFASSGIVDLDDGAQCDVVTGICDVSSFGIFLEEDSLNQISRMRITGNPGADGNVLKSIHLTPEPSTAVMMGLGLLGLVRLGRRRSS